MSSIWRKYFIPHQGNEYKPHSLRNPAFLVTLATALGFYGLFLIYPTVLEKTNFTATILPAVLTDLANESRTVYGAPSLQTSLLLVEAAQLKADDMAKKNYFAHTSPEGFTPWHWFNAVDYQFSYAGENLAVNFTDSEEVTNAWLNSPSHRANILNRGFTEIGIATAEGRYKDREAIFVVQLFGTPITAGTKAEEKITSETKTPEIIREEVKASLVQEEPYIEGETLSGTPPIEPLPSPVFSSEAQARYASPLEKFAANPRTALGYIYGGLIFIIIISLLLNIFIEIRRQHPRHIFRGIFLLLVLVFLVLVTQSPLLSPLVIR